MLTTSDKFFVNVDLEMMSKQQTIAFTDLTDADDKAAVGDQVVTSYTSSKYLPGLLIGQIQELNKDSNNLTKSGTITPVVDFEHIKNVLVILDKKQAVQTKEN